MFSYMAEKLKFYDLRKKKAFTTTEYTIKKEKGRYHAACIAPSGCKARIFISEEFAKKNKK